MRCYNCGKPLRKKVVEKYHYLESGLPNVYLKGVTMYYCSCGEEMVGIPCPEGLHDQIAKTIAKNSRPLTGDEIRFLRKHLGLMSGDLARILGVSKVTVSRWENSKAKIDKSYESILRAMTRDKKLRKLFQDINVKKKPDLRKSPPYVFDVADIALACAS